MLKLMKGIKISAWGSLLLQNKLPQNRIRFYGSFPKISLKDFIARGKVEPLQINFETFYKIIRMRVIMKDKKTNSIPNIIIVNKKLLDIFLAKKTSAKP